MNKQEILIDIINKLKISELFRCPSSNHIQNHNNKIIALLTDMLEEDITPEDNIIWDNIITGEPMKDEHEGDED